MARRNATDHLGMQQVADKPFRVMSTDTMMGLLETIARVRDMVDLDEPGTEAFFTEQVSHLSELQTECDAAGAVVQERFKTYLEADLQTRAGMNLSATLADDMAQAYDNHQLKGMPQKTEAWRRWCKEINIALPEDLEDDELQIEGGAEFRNSRCVLSQKSIFDLRDPVEDDHEYIWERAAIVEHIRAHHGRARNPANQTLPITEAELKPSRRVVREAQRRKREAATTQAPALEIL